MQKVKVFSGYGDTARLEGQINGWLLAEPRKVLSIQATDLRLFIRWQPGVDFHRHSPSFFSLFRTMANGQAETQFDAFFEEHPNAKIIFEAVNQSFIFWFWADET